MLLNILMIAGGNPSEYNGSGTPQALGTFDNPYLYKTYYYDLETGMYYLDARYYNPEIGRFITEDPDPGEDTDRLSKNPYIYCYNDPITNSELFCLLGRFRPSQALWCAMNASQSQHDALVSILSNH